MYLTSSPTAALPGEIDIKFIGKDEKDTGTAKYLATERPKIGILQMLLLMMEKN